MSLVLMDRKLLADLVAYWNLKGNGQTGSPGHCHETPGVWDQGNPEGIAGMPCAECAVYDAARAILAEAEPVPAQDELLEGIAWVSDPYEANVYRLRRGTCWVARIQMSGEMMVERQEALLNAMLAARAAQAEQQPVAVPEGWRLVPVDAPLEMVEALKARLLITNRGGILNAGNALNDAIAAAPVAPPALQVPGRLPLKPFQTVDRGSANYRAGWNACRKAMLEGSPEDETRAVAPWRAVVSRKKSPVGTLRGAAVAYLTLECGHTVQVTGEQAIERNYVKRKRCKQCMSAQGGAQ